MVYKIHDPVLSLSYKVLDSPLLCFTFSHDLTEGYIVRGADQSMKSLNSLIVRSMSFANTD